MQSRRQYMCSVRNDQSAETELTRRWNDGASADFWDVMIGDEIGWGRRKGGREEEVTSRGKGKYRKGSWVRRSYCTGGKILTRLIDT